MGGRAGADATSVDFFDVAEAFHDETDLSVWQRIVGGLGHSIASSTARPVSDSGHGFATLWARARPPRSRSGRRRIRSGPRTSRVLRRHGGVGDDADAKTRARDLYRQETAGTDVDPSLFAAAVHIIASLTAPPRTSMSSFVRFQAVSSLQEESRFLSVLADFDDPDLTRRLLAMSLTDDVRTQNAPYLPAPERSRTVSRASWPGSSCRTSGTPSTNASRATASCACSKVCVRCRRPTSRPPEVFVFFETHEVPQGDKTLAQHLERLEVNVALRGRESSASPTTCTERYGALLASIAVLTTVPGGGGHLRGRARRHRRGRCSRRSLRG